MVQWFGIDLDSILGLVFAFGHLAPAGDGRVAAGMVAGDESSLPQSQRLSILLP